jgi:hypothetical protein
MYQENLATLITWNAETKKSKYVGLFQTGIDVTITIFSDFSPIFGKNLAFFLQSNVAILFLLHLSVFRNLKKLTKLQ